MPKVPQRPAEPAAEWVEQRIEIPTTDGGKAKVSAKVLGTLAVHKGLGNPPAEWCVTHVPTGLYIAYFREETDALMVVDEMWEKCRDAFKQTRKDVFNEVTRDKYPWLDPWVKYLNARKTYVEPANQ